MLSTLSNQSKIWIFQSDKLLTKSEVELIKSALDAFIPEWAAHGVNLNAAYEVVENVFIIIGADEDAGTASGCSIDALTRQVKLLGEALKVDFFNRLIIAYEDHNGNLQLVDMNTFKSLIGKDVVRQNTMVYNNLITTKADLIDHWKIKVADSWHANLMPIL